MSSPPQPPGRDRLRFLAPNLVTIANISCGFASLGMAADGRYDLAVWILYVAIVLDALDGKIARWLKATSEFGKQLDSFSDALSFGAAPAFLVWRANTRSLHELGLAVSLVYLIAGVLRLARFNLMADAHGKSKHTMGLPIPIGAGYLMAAVAMREEVSPNLAAMMILVISMSMVSRWPLPNLRGKDAVTAMLLVGAASYTVVLLFPSWWAVAWWNLWNVAILVAASSENRRERPAL